MAPEILGHVGHGLAADWWSFGVVMFEMLTGGKPFDVRGSDGPSQLLALIHRRSLAFPAFPTLSDTVRDLLSRLLDPDPVSRLKGQAVLEHGFFASISPADLAAKALVPPWVPDIDDGDDSSEGEDLSYFPASVTEQTPPSVLSAGGARPLVTAAAVATDDAVSASVGTLDIADGVFGSFGFASPSVVGLLRMGGRGRGAELPRAREPGGQDEDVRAAASSPLTIQAPAHAGESGGLFVMSPP